MPMDSTDRALNRRDFLAAGSAAAAAGWTGSTTLAAGAFSAEKPLIEADVVVCGGGCAGLAAALAASRRGAKTLMLERAGFAGGIITTVGLPYFDGLADIKDKRIVVRGIGLELLSKSGVCEPNATHVKAHAPIVPSVEKFKLLADNLLAEQSPKLSILYHTIVCEARRENDRIAEILIANKGGLTRVRAKTFIDCTGDADVARFAGCETERSPELQPMTMHFRVGNVKRTPDTSRLVREATQKAQDRGELPMFYGPGLTFCFAPDEAYVHGIRVPGDAADPVDLTRAEAQGRRDAWAMFNAWKKDVPGFEESYFISSGPFIGVRETRRIVGRHVLNEKEIQATTKFDDAIATGCWYLDLHPNKTTVGGANSTPKIQPAPYDIPYRSLLAKEVNNLLVAGRHHSATQLAASSTRVTVTAMAMGEAAGAACALSAAGNTPAANIDGRDVRRDLSRLGGGPIQDWAAR
jgi:hypothetical protein